MTALLAIIGGSGVNELPGLKVHEALQTDTAWGTPSAPVLRGEYHGEPVLFLTRHGRPHAIAPHAINYRANIAALHAAGARRIIAMAAVGGISAAMEDARLVIPDQLIDYTWGRAHSFLDGQHMALGHVDFTWPYDATLRRQMLAAAAAADIDVVDGACMAVTQGPRLETAAEVARLARDGCDIVGMTGMPEAALAREMDIAYACCAIVANRAAGLASGEITMEMVFANLARGVDKAVALLRATVAARPPG